jgi:uncharacterized membrane protein (DUF4010 family)
MDEIDLLRRMGVALTVGLIIGFERGWHERQAPEGTRVAGIRTFSLIGFAGGLVAVLGIEFSAGVAAAITIGLAGLLLIVRLTAAADADVGATTEVAAVVAFSLGALAGLGHLVPAIAGSVASAFLLGAKPVLHRWLRGIDQKELFATLQIVLISAVILPLLPDKGFGPFGALNPRRLWLLVVIVAGVSFVGYVGARLVGSRAGALLTGLCGGLVASTATTLTLARRAKEVDRQFHRAIAAGIVAACTTMFARMAILAAIIYPPLLREIAPPFGAALVVGGSLTVWLWLRGGAGDAAPGVDSPRNPLELRTAVAFALLLATILVATEAVRSKLGPAGLYLLAGISGLADVDAITVSIAGQAERQLASDVAVFSLAIAATINTLVKAAIAGALAPRTVSHPVAIALALVLAAVALAFVGVHL